MWKFCENTQFLLSFGYFRRCASIQNFHTRKLGKVFGILRSADIFIYKKEFSVFNFIYPTICPFWQCIIILTLQLQFDHKKKRNMKLCYTLAYLKLEQGELHKSRESFTIFFQNREFI